MKTLLEVLNLSTEYLKQRKIEPSRRLAEDLISSALKLKRMDLYLQFDRPMTNPELETCRSWLKRAGNHEPVAYIRGDVEFMGCTLQVNPSVLIPRQETEILADKIIQILKNENLENKILWDLCCGSGSLAIALKKHLPQLQVSMSDISADALAVAKHNAQTNQVEITPILGDLLTPFSDKRADFIVCNPPYIGRGELETLDSSVKEHEPIQALVSGETGLEIYEKLATELPNYLNSGGKVWLEIGKDQGNQLSSLFKAPIWTKKAVEKDWAGHDRFFSLEIE